MKQPAITIVIVDDHEVVCKGLQTLLGLETDVRILGKAGSVAEAVPLVERTRPQIVLLDIKLPDASGIEACRRILLALPETRILVLTSFAQEATVVAAIQSGAHGYVLKDVRSHDLIHAIRTVASGHGYLDPRVAQQALRWIRTQQQTGESPPRIADLSSQERLIMPLLAEGKTNKEIATAITLSDKTIKNYLANIFEKLHVTRRTEAVAWYVKQLRPPSPK